MVYEIILIVITLIGLIIGTITDLKKREVPDWLSYGLISVGLGLNLLFSLIYWDYWFILNSLVGFIIFLLIALAMFYTGQWGGGDSKILMGLGALIGFDIRFRPFPLFIHLFVNILLIGAVYGLLWSFFLILKNWKDFWKEFKKRYQNKTTLKARRYVLLFALLMITLFFIFYSNPVAFIFPSFGLFVLITFYLIISVKAVEKSSMVKSVTPDKLTEGDWIVKEIKYQGKYICGPKDLGIGKKQIKQLLKLYEQNKIKKVLIKEGIPFVPSFLIAYIITLLIGNLLFLLL